MPLFIGIQTLVVLKVPLCSSEAWHRVPSRATTSLICKLPSPTSLLQVSGTDRKPSLKKTMKAAENSYHATPGSSSSTPGLARGLHPPPMTVSLLYECTYTHTYPTVLTGENKWVPGTCPLSNLWRRAGAAGSLLWVAYKFEVLVVNSLLTQQSCTVFAQLLGEGLANQPAGVWRVPKIWASSTPTWDWHRYIGIRSVAHVLSF